jgi:hypothetical protein
MRIETLAARAADRLGLHIWLNSDRKNPYMLTEGEGCLVAGSLPTIIRYCAAYAWKMAEEEVRANDGEMAVLYVGIADSICWEGEKLGITRIMGWSRRTRRIADWANRIQDIEEQIHKFKCSQGEVRHTVEVPA